MWEYLIITTIRDRGRLYVVYENDRNVERIQTGKKGFLEDGTRFPKLIEYLKKKGKEGWQVVAGYSIYDEVALGNTEIILSREIKP